MWILVEKNTGGDSGMKQSKAKVGKETQGLIEARKELGSALKWLADLNKFRDVRLSAPYSPPEGWVEWQERKKEEEEKKKKEEKKKTAGKKAQPGNEDDDDDDDEWEGDNDDKPNWAGMTVAKLREQLGQRGQRKNGNKAELIARLVAYTEANEKRRKNPLLSKLGIDTREIIRAMNQRVLERKKLNL